MFQDDFCQQVFEALVEILRKESQNRLSGGQVAEGHQPGEAVQGLEQLQGRQSGHGWVRRVRVGAEDGRKCAICQSEAAAMHSHQSGWASRML